MEAALRVCRENGVPAAVTAKAEASLVRAAGKELEKELGEGAGIAEREELSASLRAKEAELTELRTLLSSKSASALAIPGPDPAPAVQSAFAYASWPAGWVE